VATVCALQITWPLGIPWAYGLTTGAVGLIINLAVFLLSGLLVPRSAEEEARLAALFETESEQPGRAAEALA
jgi:SSS family solute:Na+ symporter